MNLQIHAMYYTRWNFCIYSNPRTPPNRTQRNKTYPNLKSFIFHHTNIEIKVNDDRLQQRWYIRLFSSLAGLQGVVNAQNGADDQVGGPKGGHGQHHRSAGEEVRWRGRY